jgi:hypothetical protein
MTSDDFSSVSQDASSFVDDFVSSMPWWYRPIETQEDREHAAALLYGPMASRC